MTKVSVLIPVNSITYIKETIESVYNQSFEPEEMELVIITQGIPEKKILELIPNSKKIKVSVTENPEKGIASSLNLGLLIAQGEFISRIDGDDIMMENRITNQVRFLESHPDVLVVGGHIALIDEYSKFYRVKEYEASDENIRARILERSPVAQPAVTFRKVKIQEIGGYRSLYSEDTDLWLRVLKVGKIANLDEIVIKYRVHTNQFTQEKINTTSTPRNAVWLSHLLRENFKEDLPGISESEVEWLERKVSEFQGNWREKLILSEKWSPTSEINSHLVQIKAMKIFKRPIFMCILLLRHPFLVLGWLKFKIQRVVFIYSKSYKKIGF